jgi:hypothetical protein
MYCGMALLLPVVAVTGLGDGMTLRRPHHTPSRESKGSEPAAPPAAQLEDQKRTEMRKGVLSDKRM